jgi:hypothetical protein
VLDGCGDTEKGQEMSLISRIFGKRDEWEYGTAGNNSRPARRHKKRGNVQFVLWKAGEQGHAEDYWHDFDSSWWPTFKPSNAK